MFVGQIRMGRSVSVTVTEKLHVVRFPPRSMATQLTPVTPFANREPDGGSQPIVGSPQLSVAITLNVTAASHLPGSVLATMFVGQTRDGFSSSFTVTVKLHWLVFPFASLAAQRTV